MTTKAHSTLTGSDLHEPKGISTATSGQVYYADGAGSGAWATPAATPAGPGLVHIKTQSASSSSTIDFVNGVSSVVLDNTYEAYQIKISSYVPSSDNSNLGIRIGTGGGPTYATTGYYGLVAEYYITAPSSNSSLADNSTSGYIPLNASNTSAVGFSNAAGRQAHFTIDFANPEITNKCTFYFRGVYKGSSGALHTVYSGHGLYDTSTAITAIRFLPNAGTILSGTFSLYGFAKS